MIGLKKATYNVLNDITDILKKNAPSYVKQHRSDAHDYAAEAYGKSKTGLYSAISGGIVSGIIEGVATSPLLMNANKLSFNVVEQGGKLYQIFPWRELDWGESHIVYPLLQAKFLEIPATTWLWLLSMLPTAVLGYYATKFLYKKWKGGNTNK